MMCWETRHSGSHESHEGMVLWDEDQKVERSLIKE